MDPTSSSDRPAVSAGDELTSGDLYGVSHEACGGLQRIIDSLRNPETKRADLTQQLSGVLGLLQAATYPQVSTAGRPPVSILRTPGALVTVKPAAGGRRRSVLSLMNDQQQAAIESARTHRVSKIDAGPGTGKTTTLAAVARVLPRRGLYIAYNKDIQRDAGQRFPGRVPAMTTHALAYGAVGQEYRAAGKQIRDPYIPEIKTLLGLNGPDATSMAYAARETLSHFMNTVDDRVTARHITPRLREGMARRLAAGAENSEVAAARLEEAVASVVKLTQSLWDQAASRTSPAPLPHDGYLKLWQQQGVRLLADFIMVDEYQDSTPVMQAIYESQQARVVVVGDQFQAIYAWRGAVNGLESLRAPLSQLTKTYRFGKNLAEVGNAILRSRGSNRLIEACGRDPGRLGDVDPNKPYTLIARTNAGLCARAADLSVHARTSVVGGTKELVDLMKAAYGLYADRRDLINHQLLRSFKSYGTFKAYVESTGDRECQMVARMVDTHCGALPSIISALESNLVPEGQAHITLTTAHKAKGREWDQVLIAEDFPDPQDSRGNVRTEESNLMFVSATRARKVMQINQRMAQVMRGAPAPVAPRIAMAAQPVPARDAD